MTIAELHAKIEAALEAAEVFYESAQFAYYGIRFEYAARAVGDICPRSKHNPDRADERDFPTHGSDEYEDLPTLGGTSAWQINDMDDAPKAWWRRCYAADLFGRVDVTSQANVAVRSRHCYLVAGNNTATHDDCDAGEIVIRNARVLAVIF